MRRTQKSRTLIHRITSNNKDQLQNKNTTTTITKPYIEHTKRDTTSMRLKHKEEWLYAQYTILV